MGSSSRRGHPRARARSGADLAGDEWLCFEPREVTDKALRALGVLEPKQITQCESLNVLLALLTGSNMLAVAWHRILDLPQLTEAIQEIRIAERMPALTVGLYTRADAPLTRPAAALARLLLDIGRGMLPRA